MKSKPRRLAIFVSFSGAGGVERVILNLLEGFSSHDIEIDLLAVVGKHGWLPDINWPNVRVIDLGVKHTHLALFALARYLKEERPDVLMAAKDRGVRIAVMAHWLAGVDTRLVGQLHNNISGLLKTKSAFQCWLRTAPMRWLFPRADLIICVSEGVIEDTMQITGMPREKLMALPNPIFTPDIYLKAQKPSLHPWLDDPSVPVILGAGRLTREKDFQTLIRAFSLLQKRKDCRLIIMGEGPMRHELQQLIVELGLSDKVSMPGYQDNLFSFMQKASLFALSSAWEGLGNVLIEAMALGVPVVSTDCPYGPSETLANGRFGALVPVGDHEALAEAMFSTLQNPLSAAELKEAVARFSVECSSRLYLEALGFA